ncbi:Uncharacterized protein dnl_64380 [Desulfonema limicola]|uniref:Uncharacterized protein n=1 Tax=Desulfonema limicola TaxID=45656 RepID=A0A975BET9_9BACT|nr:Uncharacterized protein dnl_64380 [Desulfonema limicola]
MLPKIMFVKYSACCKGFVSVEKNLPQRSKSLFEIFCQSSSLLPNVMFVKYSARCKGFMSLEKNLPQKSKSLFEILSIVNFVTKCHIYQYILCVAKVSCQIKRTFRKN